jgi:predicted metal-dependent HD superfamily phosphohydrolase
MNESYKMVNPAEVDYILVKTTSEGPFVDDVFYVVLAGESSWTISDAEGEEFMDWMKSFEDVDSETFFNAMTCTDDRIFIIYRGGENPVLGEKGKVALRKRLETFLRENFEGEENVLDQISDGIFTSYQEEHRSYHNLQHIQDSLSALDKVNDLNDKRTLELAIWYHDIIYVPASSRNESESVNRMKKDFETFATTIDLDKTSQLILCSPSDARVRELSQEEKYFLDIDYSVIGRKKIEYLAYSQKIRQENSRIPRWIYNMKRRSFLKSLANKELFFTPFFRDNFSAQARENIRDELKSMPFPFNIG